jgi:hypothetical protein
MNIGEMQRKLSLWAEQDAGRKFHGLFDLICCTSGRRSMTDRGRAGCHESGTSGSEGGVGRRTARHRVRLLPYVRHVSVVEE